MAIYKMVGDKERLELVQETSFNNESIKEVEDLQRLILAQPEVLEPGLFIIRAEFSEWKDSKRRIDLLAMDKGGRLVVIELKRGETGDHSELQALRYAAMAANVTIDKLLDTYAGYAGCSEEEARIRFREHLGLADGEDLVVYSEKPRIILGCETFGNEIATSVLWLNSYDMEIKCIRLRPYRMGGEILVETSQLIPLPEAQDFLVKVREREVEQAKTQHSGMGQFIPGGAMFKEQLELAQEGVQGDLERLYNWAVGLEKDGLAVLSTYRHQQRCNLLVGIPIGNNPSLIRVIMDASAIRFQPSYFKEYAPVSIPRLRETFEIDVLGYSGSFNRKLENVGDALLAVLTQAYREANGLLEQPSGPEQPKD